MEFASKETETHLKPKIETTDSPFPDSVVNTREVPFGRCPRAQKEKGNIDSWGRCDVISVSINPSAFTSSPFLPWPLAGLSHYVSRGL